MGKLYGFRENVRKLFANFEFERELNMNKEWLNLIKQFV